MTELLNDDEIQKIFEGIELNSKEPLSSHEVLGEGRLLNRRGVMSVCCNWCGSKLTPYKKHICRKKDIKRHVNNYDPKTDLFLWMQSWLQVYDSENKGLEGKKIMDWIYTKDTKS